MTTTATELRTQAAAHDRAAHESFERCDTDGALSQWSHGLLAAQARLQATIEENGGRALFPTLFDLTGNLVPAKQVQGEWGPYWVLLAGDDPDGRTRGWFGPSKAKKAQTARRADAAKGYYVGYVMAPAKAELRGGNIACVAPVAVRTDGGFSRDVIVVDDGQHDEYGEVLGRWYAIHGDLL
ncbi:hypothetical protein ACFOWE_18040 [Planomonospora corallina]|uniref:Uncharacterized protein n=1 Tax=Planomonospora corallina TaxID=1806052 RepID=A0ABV8I7N2_9ACTN